jgi:hypothetical protein
MLKKIIGKQLDYTDMSVQGLTNEEIKLTVLEDLGLDCAPDEFQPYTNFKKAGFTLEGQKHTFRCPIWYPKKKRKKDDESAAKVENDETQEEKASGFYTRIVCFFHITQAKKDDKEAA